MRVSGMVALIGGLGFAIAGAQAVTMGGQAAPAPAAAGATPPPGPGLDAINGACGFCHSTAQVFSQRKTPAAWAATVQSMIDRGADVSPADQKVIVDYLGKNFSAPAGTPGADHVPPPPAGH